ncbi:hypothetical protein FB45DRAFT_389742 [Roridomyces roridus]|uniref:Uncharacterized protein n=1 Tax=Roridomyces roridus TaxID=1738132 RepID=A0AAD7B1Y8_9AGAR|nr:hypothetical protein FB45DRAFT_389742 [Roridomyces roridus]
MYRRTIHAKTRLPWRIPRLSTRDVSYTLAPPLTSALPNPMYAPSPLTTDDGPTWSYTTMTFASPSQPPPKPCSPPRRCDQSHFSSLPSRLRRDGRCYGSGINDRCASTSYPDRGARTASSTLRALDCILHLRPPAHRRFAGDLGGKEVAGCTQTDGSFAGGRVSVR